MDSNSPSPLSLARGVWAPNCTHELEPRVSGLCMDDEEDCERRRAPYLLPCLLKSLSSRPDFAQHTQSPLKIFPNLDSSFILKSLFYCSCLFVLICSGFLLFVFLDRVVGSALALVDVCLASVLTSPARHLSCSLLTQRRAPPGPSHCYLNIRLQPQPQGVFNRLGDHDLGCKELLARLSTVSCYLFPIMINWRPGPACTGK